MLLEILFGWFSTFQLHTLYHHVFGRIYFKIKKDPVILNPSETVYLKGHLYLDM